LFDVKKKKRGLLGLTSGEGKKKGGEWPGTTSHRNQNKELKKKYGKDYVAGVEKKHGALWKSSPRRNRRNSKKNHTK